MKALRQSVRPSALRGSAKAFGRIAMPVAVGIAAVDIVRGESTVRDTAIDLAAHGAVWIGAGLAAGFIVSNPVGWVAGAILVGKVAATLLLGDRLSRWVKEGGVSQAWSWGKGVLRRWFGS
jgi:hypothetical protein